MVSFVAEMLESKMVGYLGVNLVVTMMMKLADY